MLLKTSVLLLLTVAGAAQALNVWKSNDMLDDLNAAKTDRQQVADIVNAHRDIMKHPFLPRKMRVCM